MARATVVVVSYNSAARLPACLSAVCGFFDPGSDEVIVVDNNSADGSRDVIASVCSRAQVIANRRNVGFARAVNQALAVASGDYVVLVNPDVHDISGSRGRVEQLLADPAVAAVAVMLTDDHGVLQRSCTTTPSPSSTVAEGIGGEGRIWVSRARDRHRLLDWDMSDERDVDHACGALLFLSGAALRRLGPFDERFFLYGEETDWLRRAKGAGMRVVYTPSVRAVHAGGESARDQDDAALTALLTESRYRYLRKWYGAPAELGTRAAMMLVDLARTLRPTPDGSAARERSRLARHRLPIHLGRRAARGE